MYKTKNIGKEITTGVVASGLVAGLGFLIVSLIFTAMLSRGVNGGYTFTEEYTRLLYSDALPKLLTLGTLPNLLLFHLFIKKRMDYKARGVLLTVFVLAIVFVVLKVS